MPAGDTDISWQVLRRIVHEWGGTAAELAEVTPLEGGCINTTLAISTTDGNKAVLKISVHRVNRAYQDEAIQLNLLRRLGLPAPEVYAAKVGSLDDPFSYLLMEFMPGTNLGEAKKACGETEFDHLQTELAEMLLTLHAHTSSHYCRVTQAEGPMFDQWPRFYRHVFDPIWHEVEKSAALPVKSRKLVAKVHERLDRLISNDDCPRLVHWDVWATNVLAAPDGDGHWRITGLLDPNCKYAHAEAEIAYMELFHTTTPAFTRAYQQGRKLPPEYHRVRKPVYQLYSLINHVRLFGHEYAKPLMGALERVAAVV